MGQGYAGGLADLITDHGVSVDDAGGSAPAAAQPPTAQPPVAQPAPAAAQLAPTAAPSFQRPPAAPPAPPAYPAPGAYPPPAQPAQQAFPPPHHSQPASAPGSPSGHEVSLVKGRSVSLQKGQRVSLRKEDGVALSMVRMGLGWDPIKKRSVFGSREVDIDLDASALMFADQQPVDVVFFNNLRSKDGSVQHLGDNRTGAGDGDDESVIVDLARVPAHVTAIFFIVTSYEGQTFEQVQNAFCRLVDHINNSEQVRYTLGGGGAFTAMVMAKVFRESGNWKLQAIGEGMQARTPIEAVPQLGRFL